MFRSGELVSATIEFKRGLDREAFKAASLTAMLDKWGGIDAAERDEDILTVINSEYDLSQRSFMVDHWEIRNDIVVE